MIVLVQGEDLFKFFVAVVADVVVHGHGEPPAELRREFQEELYSFSQGTAVMLATKIQPQRPKKHGGSSKSVARTSRLVARNPRAPSRPLWLSLLFLGSDRAQQSARLSPRHSVLIEPSCSLSVLRGCLCFSLMTACSQTATRKQTDGKSPSCSSVSPCGYL